MTRLDIAKKYLTAGLSVIPVRPDGSKVPGLLPDPKANPWSWKRFQSRMPSGKDLVNWFGGQEGEKRGIGLVHGKVSGNSEVLDFDSREAWERFLALINAQHLAELVAQCLLVDTPSGGVHLYYRHEGAPEGNQKLARDRTGETIIETRGEGGYTVAPGSPAECHPQNRLYKKGLPHQSFHELPQFTDGERAALLAIARTCNEFIEERQYHRPVPGPSPRVSTGKRPGDDYNDNATATDVLSVIERHGGQVSHVRGSEYFLTRPGKSPDEGHSATLGVVAPNVLYVFTTSWPPFEPDRAYSPYSVFGLLECGGDFQEAARRLAALGYGESLSDKYRQDSHNRETASDPETRIGFALFQVGEFLQTIGDPPPMLVEGILPDHSLILLTGKPKYGKSLLALDLAESIATDRAIWGTRILNRPGAAVYLGMEDGRYEIANRLIGLGIGQTSNLSLYISAERLVLGSEEGVDALREAVMPLSPSLVIVDTAREAMGIRDYSDAAEVTDRLRPLREFAREVCTVLLVSHNRKAEANDAVDEIAGSNGLTSAVDGWISARRKEDREEDGKRFRRLHLDIDGRGGMRCSVVVELDPDTMRFREISEDERQEERSEERAERDSKRFAPIHEYLSQREGATVAEVAKGTHLHEGKVRRLLEEMFKASQIAKISRPNPEGGRPAQVFSILSQNSSSPDADTMKNSEKPEDTDPWGDGAEEME